MNKKNLICFLLIVILLGVFYLYHADEESHAVDSSMDLSGQPIYQSDNMTTDIYDLSGEIIYKITSDNVKHFDSSNSTEFTSPHLTLFDQEHKPTWHIEAKQATLTDDKLLYLNHDVELNNLTPDAQIKQVKTDNAVVDLTTQLVTSDDPITIKGVGFSSTGTGLAGNLKEKTAKILENVKTLYNTEAN